MINEYFSIIHSIITKKILLNLFYFFSKIRTGVGVRAQQKILLFLLGV